MPFPSFELCPSVSVVSVQDVSCRVKAIHLLQFSTLMSELSVTSTFKQGVLSCVFPGGRANQSWEYYVRQRGLELKPKPKKN